MIAPNGTFDFEWLTRGDGNDFVIITLPHADGPPVELSMNFATFTAFADHCTMIADAIASGLFTAHQQPRTE